MKNLRGKTSGAGIPTSLRFIPRQVETDADTRKAGRREVDILPASTAIVNVYQLVKKEKKGGAAERRRLGTQKTKRQSGSRQQPQTRMKYPSYIIGREIDEDGNLIQLPGESDLNYEKNNKLQHQRAEAAKQEEEVRKTVEYTKNIKEQTELGKKTVAKSQATSPQAILRNRISKDKIPYTEKVERWDSDKRYSPRSLGDPDDIERINRAINNAVKEGRMGEVPPPIVAVGTRMNSPQSTTTVYIKNDVSESRRRKMTHTKVKRSVGNKRRVVMKKKGGKR